LLVALQLLLVGQIGEIGVVGGAGALLVVLDERCGGVIVVIGVAMPVDVERDVIGR